MKERANIARIESALKRGADGYFCRHNFVEIVNLPHIVGITGACENIDTLFKVDYFGQQGYLTQTGQLALELQIPELERVCCTIKSFRAEPEADKRHQTEFPLIEFEFKYEGQGLPELLDRIEGTIKAMVLNALARDQALEDLGATKERLEKEIANPYERITYRDALGLLKEHGHNLEFGADLKHNHEQIIVKAMGKSTFVTHYPEKIKFFNMRRDKEDPDVVQSADLLLPYSGEAVGSAVREENPELLEQKLLNSEMYRLHKEGGGSLKEFKWYLNAVKKHPVPHAGCGIGLNRVTQYVLGRDDIRKCSAYPMNWETDLNNL